MMNDVLLYCEHSPAFVNQLQTIKDFCTLHEASLTGLYTVPDLTQSVYGEIPIPPQVLADYVTEASATAGIVKDQFETYFPTKFGSHQWLFEKGYAGKWIVDHAKYAELIVMGQMTNESVLSENSGLVETVLLASGRPLLILPEKSTVSILGQRILYAWDGSREAVRAGKRCYFNHAASR